MAVTKIWDIKGRIGNVVIYVENPDKTAMPEFSSSSMTDSDIQNMQDVMEFAMTDERAEDLGHVISYAASGKKTEQQYYVSALNCQLETAREEMLLTKKACGKTDGITAFHGYQAFKPGEVTPDVAHEIGVKLAQELWGERFEVVIATHLDRGHIHNHFVLNSVSFKDGNKYYDGNKTYALMRKTSDRLCREYALSVIESPEYGRTKHYAEWQAEQEGKPTWRGLIKADIDDAIRQSVTESQFFRALRAKGYEVKNQKYLSVRPTGKERFFRLERNFGEEYSLKAINKRILANRYPVFPAPNPPPTIQHYKMKGSLRTTKKLTGFRALYFHYLYLLGKIPKQGQRAENGGGAKPNPSPKQIYFLYREDLLKLDKLSAEIKLLCRNRIDTSEQLFSYKNGLTEEMTNLTEQRKRLRSKMRSIREEGELSSVKAEIAALSRRLGILRKEVRLCDDIANRTQEMKAKMAKERQDKIQNNKTIRREQKPHDRIR